MQEHHIPLLPLPLLPLGGVFVQARWALPAAAGVPLVVTRSAASVSERERECAFAARCTKTVAQHGKVGS